MTPDALLLALRDVGIRVEADGDALRWHGPKDAMTTPLTAALKEHKPLLLAVARTISDRERDADWETVWEWALDNGAKTITPAVHAAGRRLSLAVRDDEWPATYARRIMGAVRVRALLRAFAVAPPVATMHEADADNGKQRVA